MGIKRGSASAAPLQVSDVLLGFDSPSLEAAFCAFKFKNKACASRSWGLLVCSVAALIIFGGVCGYYGQTELGLPSLLLMCTPYLVLLLVLSAGRFDALESLNVVIGLTWYSMHALWMSGALAMPPAYPRMVICGVSDVVFEIGLASILEQVGQELTELSLLTQESVVS
jgi:hypothetical protein